MADAPERIRVAQDADGFWTCREAVSGSQEYVRADLALTAGEQEPVAWQPMATAPKGCVTEDAGIRGESEWFLGRVSPEFRKQGAAPFVVIKRRAWPQEDSWRCNGEAHYVPRYFDAWAPLGDVRPAPPTAQLEALRNRVAELEKALDSIKAKVCGDAYPYWTSSENVTSNRMWIADVCDAARRVREGEKVDG